MLLSGELGSVNVLGSDQSHEGLFPWKELQKGGESGVRREKGRCSFPSPSHHEERGYNPLPELRCLCKI